MTHKVLVTDEVDPQGVQVLRDDPQIVVDERPTLPADKVLAIIGEYDAIIGRSATKITAELLAAGKNLKVVGRAGVGIDNIAMDAATSLGIAVINAPAGNTVAVAELFFGSVLAFLRKLGAADQSMREGRWDRSGLLGREIKGRRIGIVGLGRIGGEVAVRARAFGAEVAAYDPYIQPARFEALRVERIEDLDALIARSDILTVHTPLTDETRNIIGERELSLLPAGAIVVNMARGGIVNESALAAALKSGRIEGAVVDAFSKEPLAADHPLRGLPNVFLTPHLGASTMEAQRNVAVDVCVAVREALVSGELSRSLNVPGGDTAEWSEIRNALTLATQATTVGRAILASRGTRAVSGIELACGSGLTAFRKPLLAAAAVGVLHDIVDEQRVNLINSVAIAAARGIRLSSADTPVVGDPWQIEIGVNGESDSACIAGVARPGAGARLTRIERYKVDVQPRDTLIVLTNKDVPGVIGRVGTLLGGAGVNIAEYHQSRLEQGGDALAAIAVDGTIGDDIRANLLALPEVRSVSVVQFSDGTAGRGN
ncbi:MAG: phosphoglycerate dehydrogenase [Gemmatimonadota bacterium]|nr:phosphoglycerate dehydrogenase [Gemmatimonadota bacterium]